ncbi:hypothetical protein Tco_0859163 [Tanacetum coccineum]|uniref:Uncharacterized protein n=1 Tax=Tanacetum coccineum TaxID=301880 RepID=A0ABQ5BEX1_9ASTR
MFRASLLGLSSGLSLIKAQIDRVELELKLELLDKSLARLHPYPNLNVNKYIDHSPSLDPEYDILIMSLDCHALLDCLVVVVDSSSICIDSSSYLVTDIHKKTKTRPKLDKTKHGIGKSVEN